MKKRYLLFVLAALFALPMFFANGAQPFDPNSMPDTDSYIDSVTGYRYFRLGDLWFKMEAFPSRDVMVAGFVKGHESSSVTINAVAVDPMSGATYPITGIDSGAFEGQTQLKSITFADDSNITRIEPEAFAGTSITDVVIPSTVDSVGRDAFKGDPLRTVYIKAPADDSHSIVMQDGAFDNSPANSLDTVYCEYKDAPTISENVFPNASNSELIVRNDLTPDEEYHYKNDTGWNMFKTDVFTGVDELADDIPVTDEPIELYNLSGIKVSETGVTPGIYIVRYAGRTAKVRL